MRVEDSTDNGVCYEIDVDIGYISLTIQNTIPRESERVVVLLSARDARRLAGNIAHAAERSES